MSDSESDLLLAPTVKAVAMRSIKATGQGVLWNRILLILVFAALTAFGLFSENQIGALREELSGTVSKVHDLETIVESQHAVIQRFNASVTNNDVVDRLQMLEKNVSGVLRDLHHDMAKTEAKITAQLEKTNIELNQKVKDAEDEIRQQVEKVESDLQKYFVETQDEFSMQNSFMVYQLAGTFTLLSCLISMWHMTAHLRKMNQPAIQRKILAILWMSPIYAVTSWFSLVFNNVEGYLAIIKDAYEAYIIYQFLSFCIAVLGKGDRNKVVDLLAKHADHLTPPFRLTVICEACGCCRSPEYDDPRQLASEILLQCQVFAMQFVFFRPLTTTSMVILDQLKYYGGADKPMDYRAPQLYITVVQNISIFVAFTGLLKFYHAVDQDLAWCRPFAKFLCIKGVVFMTFWQGLVISILAETTVETNDAEAWAKSAQNFLICLEMLLFSIAHFYCFPTEEWQEGYRVKQAKGKFGDSIALGDFLSDLKLIIVGKEKNKRKSKTVVALEECDEEQGEDATEVLSQQDDNERLINAINDSLGSDYDDPDIAEAKKRLLESKVLSPEFFEEFADDELIDDGGLIGMEGVEEARRELYGNGESSSTDDTDPVLKTEYGGENTEWPTVRLSETKRSSTPPTERTSLVPWNETDKGSPFMDALRPSIFTTVASLAEMEKREKNV